jgi:hypothetical protein
MRQLVFVPFNVSVAPEVLGSVKRRRKISPTLSLVREPTAILQAVEKMAGLRSGWVKRGGDLPYLCVDEEVPGLEGGWHDPTGLVVRPDGRQGAAVHPTVLLFLAACDLVQPFFFAFNQQFGVTFLPTGQQSHFSSTGNWVTSMVLWSAHRDVGIAPGQADGPHALTLDRFRVAEARFRTLLQIAPKTAPRLHQAVRFYARSLLTDEWDTLFLTQWQVLEALFSIDDREVSHQLCEYAAAIAFPRGPERVEAYRALKKLYGLRSKIVHGSASSPVVPSARSALRDLNGFVRRVLSTIVTSPRTRAIFASRKDDPVRQGLLMRALAE